MAKKSMNAVAIESPKNFKKENTRKKKIGNKPKKQIAGVTDVRYFYPRSWEELGNKRGFIEYKMSTAAINDLLSDTKQIKGDPQRYLCDYVNDNCGLIGYCIRVIAG